GRLANIQFYDNLGNLYTAALNFRQNENAEETNMYSVTVTNVFNERGDSVFVSKTEAEDGTITYGPTPITSVSFGGSDYTAEVNEETGEVTIEMDGVPLQFNASSGRFVQVGEEEGGKSVSFSLVSDGGPFVPVDVDFSKLTMFSQSGTTTLEGVRGDVARGAGAGKPVGNMSGITIDKVGKIYGTYDNGDQLLLGQIVVAKFANPAGLESIGNNMYAVTQNSGEFDGIGKDIASTGGKFNTGVLEMSNVDLANEFTEMITTQRGFQANSRIITTSDTILEELINLKR
ncbi:MAG: flagellar hook-basal body complex protein, partial [Lachnospiraceae bacterium]|nr:flagellar hook-basal body complex protein [Lachnospiraceae bacterium]